MDIIDLRFLAFRCHLAAQRSRDPDTKARLHLLGERHAATADALDDGGPPRPRQDEISTASRPLRAVAAGSVRAGLPAPMDGGPQAASRWEG